MAANMARRAASASSLLYLTATVLIVVGDPVTVPPPLTAATPPPPPPAAGRIACRLSAGGSGTEFSWSLVDVASGTLLMSGEQAAVHLDGKWWQARKAAAAAGPLRPGQLQLLRSSLINGTDKLGRYTGTVLSWSTDTAAVVWETACKTYAAVAGLAQGGVVAFESRFPAGATGTAVAGANSNDGVLSNFPLATNVNATAVLSWAGAFLRPSNRVVHGLTGGPVVFFDPDDPEGRNTTVVVGSPLDNFKATAHASKAFDGSAASWVPGTAAGDNRRNRSN